MIGLPKSSEPMPVARHRARAPDMLRPWVDVRERSGRLIPVSSFDTGAAAPRGCRARLRPHADAGSRGVRLVVHGAQEPRPCQVHMHTSLPSGSATTQNAGAASSLTRCPPASITARMRAGRQVVRDRDVEVDPVALRRGARPSAGTTRSGRRRRGRPPRCRLRRDVVPEHRGPERPDRRDVERVDRDLEHLRARHRNPRARARRRSPRRHAARSTSRCVSPPTSWLVVVTVTCPQRSSTSGWWLAASATSATRATNAAPVAKSGPVNVARSRCSRTRQCRGSTASVTTEELSRLVGHGSSVAPASETRASACERRPRRRDLRALADVPRDPRREREHHAARTRARRARSRRSRPRRSTSSVACTSCAVMALPALVARNHRAIA